jgi:hypothetical protein
MNDFVAIGSAFIFKNSALCSMLGLTHIFCKPPHCYGEGVTGDLIMCIEQRFATKIFLVDISIFDSTHHGIKFLQFLYVPEYYYT